MTASDRCRCRHARKQHHGNNGEFSCRIAIPCGCFQPDYTQGGAMPEPKREPQQCAGSVEPRSPYAGQRCMGAPGHNGRCF